MTFWLFREKIIADLHSKSCENTYTMYSSEKGGNTLYCFLKEAFYVNVNQLVKGKFESFKYFVKIELCTFP